MAGASTARALSRVLLDLPCFGAAMAALVMLKPPGHASVDMGVPLCRLQRAQAWLEAKLPAGIVIQPFSWRCGADTARR